MKKRRAALSDLKLSIACMTVAVGMLLLVACSPHPEASAADLGNTAKSDDASVMVDSVNYRHDRAMEYTVYDLRKEPPQAVGGSIVDTLASGGDKGCCLSLPLQWRPGMKVRIAWVEGDRERVYPEKHVRDLEIPRYEIPADVVVVFYAGHDVEVIVSAAEVGHPQWKGRIKKTPWEACVEEIGQKACSAAVPDPILFGLKESCAHVPEEPNCQAYFSYCKSNPHEGACP